MRRRQCQRFTKRLEVTFSLGSSKFRGISSDLSAGGLFIRTQHGLTPGSLVDIEIFLPENKVGHLKGIVRRTVKTALTMIKNGMGIEVLERDENYLDFLRNFDMLESPFQKDAPPSACAKEQKAEQKTDEAAEFIIKVCGNCNVKNRVSTQRLSLGAKCGKCGAVLEMTDIN